MLFLVQSPRKDYNLLLSKNRYNEIDQEVIYMFEECEITTWPIDCFEIARKLHYVLRPYSSLPLEGFIAAMNFDVDGYSTVEMNPTTGMYEYIIYYNDTTGNECRMRWTVLHEIGHIYLGHHDNKVRNVDVEEAEANHFAKYAIAPNPLINITHCEDATDIHNIFNVSMLASGYLYSSYQSWLHYGPRNFLPHEMHLLHLFNVA